MNRLTFVETAGKDRTGKCLWLCQCTCGQFVVVRAANIKSGNTQSCGCLRIASNKRRSSRLLTNPTPSVRLADGSGSTPPSME